MATGSLLKLLTNQALILTYLKTKLDIVNFIRWGYNEDLPILMNNRFLHFTSHVYYRSIVVDMCTLFQDHKYQANNFYLLVREEKKFIFEIEKSSISLINQKLKSSEQFFTQELVDIRNEEVSHYRFGSETKISLNHKFLPELNILYSLAKEIIEAASKGITTFIDLQNSFRNDKLFSLQKLLQDISGFNYNEAWEHQQSSTDL